ncbi:glutamate-cysteine ligase family protein [Actinokineospora guangxiensis]|uniref:Glutamate-cysteine ligase family protein n=1 Tax=Actinokineospora guangxiensis TaxID=1490288 RepID=A0ABW0EUK0_9PSEU
MNARPASAALSPSKEAARWFIDRFTASTAGHTGRTCRWVGVELEYPVVDEEGRACPPDALTAVFGELASDGWTSSTDELGRVIGARRAAETVDGQPRWHGITTDMGAATLEIQLAPEPTVHRAAAAVGELHRQLRPLLAARGLRMLGYGVQPVEPIATVPTTPKERYALVLRASAVDADGGRAARRISMSASSQVHVDVTGEDAARLLTLLNATAGLRIALMANSPHAEGLRGSGRARRELFWDESFPDRPERVGVVGPFPDLDAYARHIVGTTGFGVQRDGRFALLEPTGNGVGVLLDRGAAVAARDADGGLHHVELRPEDVCEQYGTSWFATRLNPFTGTVEDRVACQQPPEDQLVNAALVLGLAEAARSPRAYALLGRRLFPSWRALRAKACVEGFGASATVASEVRVLLDLAAEGLEERGHGEEVYLAALYDRLSARQSPADRIVALPSAERRRWILQNLAL